MVGAGAQRGVRSGDEGRGAVDVDLRVAPGVAGHDPAGIVGQVDPAPIAQVGALYGIEHDVVAALETGTERRAAEVQDVGIDAAQPCQRRGLRLGPARDGDGGWIGAVGIDVVQRSRQRPAVPEHGHPAVEVDGAGHRSAGQLNRAARLRYLDRGAGRRVGGDGAGVGDPGGAPDGPDPARHRARVGDEIARGAGGGGGLLAIQKNPALDDARAADDDLPTPARGCGAAAAADTHARRDARLAAVRRRHAAVDIDAHGARAVDADPARGPDRAIHGHRDVPPHGIAGSRLGRYAVGERARLIGDVAVDRDRHRFPAPRPSLHHRGQTGAGRLGARRITIQENGDRCGPPAQHANRAVRAADQTAARDVDRDAARRLRAGGDADAVAASVALPPARDRPVARDRQVARAEALQGDAVGRAGDARRIAILDRRWPACQDRVVVRDIDRGVRARAHDVGAARRGLEELERRDRARTEIASVRLLCAGLRVRFSPNDQQPCADRRRRQASGAAVTR